MTGKVLHSLTDLNGDGVTDLVVFSLEGRSIASKRSTYEVHLGAPTADGGTVFARRSEPRSSLMAASNSGWTDTTLIATARLILC